MSRFLVPAEPLQITGWHGLCVCASLHCGETEKHEGTNEWGLAIQLVSHCGCCNFRLLRTYNKLLKYFLIMIHEDFKCAKCQISDKLPLMRGGSFYSLIQVYLFI